MKYTSVFDIIGPAMIGPSSSHTAGAAKIGLMARKIFNGQPRHIEVVFYRSFAKTYKGHGTDLALIGGLLGYGVNSPHLVQAAEHAAKLGLNIAITTSEEDVTHPNTVKITMANKNHRLTVVGISPGGGRAEIISINDFNIKISADNNFLIIFHFDRHGVIASAAKLLASEGINIGYMEVARKSRGSEALMTIETDQVIPERITKELKKIPHVTNVVVHNK